MFWIDIESSVRRDIFTCDIIRAHTRGGARRVLGFDPITANFYFYYLLKSSFFYLKVYLISFTGIGVTIKALILNYYFKRHSIIALLSSDYIASS